MAKKKITTTEEEIIEDTPEKEINYKEDIQGKTLEQVANAPEEKEVDEVSEPIPEPVINPDEMEVEFDPAKFQEETAKQVSDQIVKALQGTNKEDTKENVNAYQKLVTDVWEKEHRTPSWDEVLPLIEEAAVQRIESKQKAAYDAQQAQVQEQQKVQNDYYNNVNAQIEEELTELYQNNKLPKIKDDKNPNDAGIQARDALFTTMATVNKERVEKGMHPITSVARIHNNYYKAPNRQPAGADAAIIANHANSTPNDDEEINYLRDVKGKPWYKFGRK